MEIIVVLIAILGLSIFIKISFDEKRPTERKDKGIPSEFDIFPSGQYSSSQRSKEYRRRNSTAQTGKEIKSSQSKKGIPTLLVHNVFSGKIIVKNSNEGIRTDKHGFVIDENGKVVTDANGYITVVRMGGEGLDVNESELQSYLAENQTTFIGTIANHGAVLENPTATALVTEDQSLFLERLKNNGHTFTAIGVISENHIADSSSSTINMVEKQSNENQHPENEEEKPVEIGGVVFPGKNKAFKKLKEKSKQSNILAVGMISIGDGEGVVKDSKITALKTRDHQSIEGVAAVGMVAAGNTTIDNSVVTAIEENRSITNQQKTTRKKKIKGENMITKKDNFTAIGMIASDNVTINNSIISGIGTTGDLSSGNQIDLKKLAQELSLLRKAMKKQSHTSEHDIAIADVARAEQAIKKGENKELLTHLKSAGNWALNVATQIGVSVAIEAIKISLGLK